jgi:hypothetical protein
MFIRFMLVMLVVVFCLAGVDARAQNDAQIQQYVQLLQPLMWQELNFIRQVCDLTPEQRPQIRTAADVAVKEGAKAVLQPQKAQANAKPVMVMRSQPTAGAQAIRESLHETLKKTLTSEQLEHYEAEDAKRAGTTKQATILGVVALLDAALFLSPEQREKIVANLDTSWQREWEQWLLVYQYNGQYVPQIPDQHVVPLLNEEQRLVWSGLQKVSFNSWHNNGQQQNDDGWWNPQGAKTAKATANPKGKAALLKASKKE